ncbi:MAG: hypothetical protein LBR22_02405 [Desulfovibrio sp.]|nr:hypothetical protein [Desulfovibrio sp.]
MAKGKSTVGKAGMEQVQCPGAVTPGDTTLSTSTGKEIHMAKGKSAVGKAGMEQIQCPGAVTLGDTMLSTSTAKENHMSRDTATIGNADPEQTHLASSSLSGLVSDGAIPAVSAMPVQVAPAVTMEPQAMPMQVTPAVTMEPQAMPMQVAPAVAMEPQAMPMQVAPAVAMEPQATPMQVAPAVAMEPQATPMQVAPGLAMTPQATPTHVAPAVAMTPQAMPMQVAPAVTTASTAMPVQTSAQEDFDASRANYEGIMVVAEAAIKEAARNDDVAGQAEMAVSEAPEMEASIMTAKMHSAKAAAHASNKAVLVLLAAGKAAANLVVMRQADNIASSLGAPLLKAWEWKAPMAEASKLARNAAKALVASWDAAAKATAKGVPGIAKSDPSLVNWAKRVLGKAEAATGSATFVG